jgi:hypothetical protein
LAPGGKWADELEATGMVKAEAGRPGPYCLGRLILRHRIDAKRCSIDPTRSRHTASARQRGGGVYDRQQIDRRRRSPKGKKIDPVAILCSAPGSRLYHTYRRRLHFRQRLSPVSFGSGSLPIRRSDGCSYTGPMPGALRGMPTRTHRTSSPRRAAPSPRQQTNTGAYLCGAGLRL